MPPPYNSLPNVSGMITVKVVIDDTTRRLKLPYPILTAEQLPAKLRELLVIKAEQQIKIERFSDSAKSFVDLASDDSNVYRQLQRAAKAKGKIRLLITRVDSVAPEPLETTSLASEAVRPWSHSASSQIPHEALRDYQMQLMILEQQNRARLYKARMENINQVVAGREIETSNFLARDEYSQMRHQYNPRLSQTVMPQLPADSVISAKKPMDCSNAMNLSPSPHGETLNASTIERQNADVQNIRIRQDHYLRAMKQQRQILEAQKRQMTDIAKSTPNFAPVMSTNGCRRLLPSLHTLQVHGEQIASSIAAQEAVKPIPLDPRLFYHSMAQASHQTPVGSSVANGSKPRPIHPPVGLTGPAASLVNADAMSMNKKDVHAVRVPKVQLYCDRCDSGITNSHYHCSRCNKGDFDLCTSCVDNNYHCLDPQHWLVKRSLVNGEIISSVTEKRKAEVRPHANIQESLFGCTAAYPRPDRCPVQVSKIREQAEDSNYRLSEYLERPMVSGYDANVENCTVPRSISNSEPANAQCQACKKYVKREHMAVCVDCASYSVCKVCLETGTHGHHPGHSYRTKTEPRKSYIDPSYLEPMFHKDHHAVCDNCDKHIRGVRHKCLDCPDFDLCNGCIGRAADLHQDHRFVPVYADITPSAAEKSRHRGIFCDGPLCIGKPPNTYIRGIRYKCAICQDLDFCEDCESSPKNDHNKTHPLVKFRTPVQNASIETIEGKNENEVLRMGDPCAPARLAVEATSKPDVSVSRQRPVQNNTPFNQLDAPDGTPKSRYENSARLMNKLRAVAELRKQPDATPLYEAIFLFDLVHDGTHFLPEQHFTQQWTVKNPGPLSWPVGCYVEYVGGEGRHMVPCQTGDLNRSELRTTLRSEGTSCEVEAGQECDFSVTLRAPATLGKKISYWRVCDPKGERFGHKLWCDIVVVDPVMEKLGNAAVRRHEHPSGVLNVAADRSFDAERAEFRRRLDAIRAKRATEASSTIDASKLRMDSPLESISKSSSDSQLLFPKLEKESPQSSMLTHMTAVTTAHIPNVTAETKAISPTSNVSDHGSLAVENPKAVQVLAELVDKLEEVNLKDTKAKDDDLLGSDVEYETIGDGSDETDEDCEWNTDDEYEILDGSEGRSA